LVKLGIGKILCFYDGPWYKSLEAYPKVWTGGTNGLHNAEVILIAAKDSAGLDEYRGSLLVKY